MRKLFILTFTFFAFVVSAQVDNPVDTLDATVDTFRVEYPELMPDSTWKLKRNVPLTLSLVVANNAFVWAFDRYALNADYARIGPESWKKNLKNGFEWDNDLFATNLIAHPYHGSLYFTAARANGAGFWGSIPYTAAGSLMWEFFMENKYPSINDFIATTVGGIGMGEMLFRLSDLAIDDRTFGGDRLARELSVFLLTPMRGITRLINGSAFQHRTVRGNQFPEIPVEAAFSGGYRMLTEKADERIKIGNMLAFDMNFVYGTPFQTAANQPYDYFRFNTSFNFSRTQPLIGRFSLLGEIYSHEVELKNLKHQLALGVFQHFNYYRIDANLKNETLAFKLSEAASIGVGAFYKYTPSERSSFLLSPHISAIIMGGSQSDHYKVDKRDYNLGSGFSGKLNVLWSYKRLNIGLDLEDYRLFTLAGNDPAKPDEYKPGLQGDVSRSALSVASLHVHYELSKSLFLIGESSAQLRRTDYKYYPSITHHILGQRLALGVWL